MPKLLSLKFLSSNSNQLTTLVLRSKVKAPELMRAKEFWLEYKGFSFSLKKGEIAWGNQSETELSGVSEGQSTLETRQGHNFTDAAALL